jgi:hypothetical protein
MVTNPLSSHLRSQSVNVLKSSSRAPRGTANNLIVLGEMSMTTHHTAEDHQEEIKAKRNEVDDDDLLILRKREDFSGKRNSRENSAKIMEGRRR